MGIAMPTAPRRFGFLAAICAAAADVDSLGLRLGVPYEHMLGHRGVTHSLVFAAVLALTGVLLAFPRERPVGRRWWTALGILFFAAASHGLLDAMTDGGLGVALLWPFRNDRYFLPWRPLVVSPIGVRRFFTAWGLRVVLSEGTLIWMPLALVWIGATFLRALRRPEPARLS